MPSQDPVQNFDVYRDALMRIADEEMEEGKAKYGDSWLNADPEYMWRRMQDKLNNIRYQTEHKIDEEEALEEFGHLINYITMYMALSFALSGEKESGFDIE